MQFAFASVAIVVLAGLVVGTTNSASAESLPFVGCAGEVQGNDLPAPKSSPVSTSLQTGIARELSYYESPEGIDIGAIAPNGWHCYSTMGTSGADLLVASNVSDIRSYENFKAVTGPLLEVRVFSELPDGAFGFVPLARRYFPKWDVSDYSTGGVLNTVPVLPAYPLDRVRYLNKNLLEFVTPPHQTGLGTYLGLPKSDLPTYGVLAMLPNGHGAPCVLVQIRLPRGLEHLRPTLIHAVEIDAVKNAFEQDWIDPTP